MLSNCWCEMMKHKGLSFYHSVWFRPGRIKTNYLIKSHEWWLGRDCEDQDREDSAPQYPRLKTRHWRNLALLVLMTSLAEMTRRIHSSQILRGYILPICNCLVTWSLRTRGTFLITDKGCIRYQWVSWGETKCNIVSWDMCRYNCHNRAWHSGFITTLTSKFEMLTS